MVSDGASLQREVGHGLRHRAAHEQAVVAGEGQENVSCVGSVPVGGVASLTGLSNQRVEQ